MELCKNFELGVDIIFDDYSDVICGLLQYKLEFYDDLYYDDDIDKKVNTIHDEWNK